MWPVFEQSLARYRELESQMSDPAVIGDRSRYTQVAKEHGSLAKTVKPYLEFLDVSQAIKEAEAMAAEGDQEIRQLAEEELASLRSKQQALRSRLEDALLLDPSED